MLVGSILPLFLPGRIIRATSTPLLEFDTRGEVLQNDSSNGDACLSINVGEVKSALELGTAITLLGVRLNALKWCVRMCMDLPEDSLSPESPRRTLRMHDTSEEEERIQLRGRLFLPRTGKLDAGAKKHAAQLAHEWVFLLFVTEL